VLALGFLALLGGLHVMFFWQGTRFLVPVLPPLLALAAVPFGSEARPVVRSVALIFGGAALLTIVWTPGSFERPQVFREPETLREIDRRVEPNAVVLVRTNEHFFRLLLRRPGTDRIWVPLGLNDHQLAVRWFHVRPYDVAPTGGDWINHALSETFSPDAVEQVIRGALQAGRPVYVSTLLTYQVPFMTQLVATVSKRFRVEPIAMPPWQLLRVRAAAS
jgi:hypothetical protein